MKTVLSLMICLILATSSFAIQLKNEHWFIQSTLELQNVLIKTRNPLDRIDIHNLLSYKFSSYQHEEAKKNAEEALRASKIVNYSRGIVDSLDNLGLIHTKMGMLDEANKYFYEIARDNAKDINYRVGLAEAYNGLGKFNQMKGQFDSAFTQFSKSKEILELLPDSSLIRNRTLANCYHGLGVLYFYDTATYEDAKKYIKKSLELREKVYEQNDLGISQYSMGEVSQNEGKYQEALEYFKKQKSTNFYNNPYINANVFQSMGDIYRRWDKIKNYSKVMDYYNKSEELFKKIGNKFQQARIKMHKGSFLREMQKYSESENMLLESFKIASEMENSNTIMVASEELEKIYKILGDKENEKKYTNIAVKEKEFLYDRTINFYLNLKITKKILFFITIILFLALVSLITIILFYFKLRAKNKELVDQKEKVEKSLHDIELLSHIGKEIISSLTIEDIIEKVYKNVNRIMDATVFSIGIYNSQLEAIDYWTKEEGNNLPPFSISLCDTNRLSIQCFRDQMPIITKNFPIEYKKFCTVRPIPIAGKAYVSHIFLPLTIQPSEKRNIKKIGVITVQSMKLEAYDDYHVVFLGNIANYAAIALDNANALKKIEIQANQLQEALEQEKKKGKLKDQFMYTLSHQYKTPLTNINLAQQYLSKFLLTIPISEQQEELVVIARNVQRIQELIDKILNFGKQFTPGVTDMDKLLREIVDGIKLRNGDENRILYKFDTEISEAFIDEGLVKILVDNLISNSLKYSEKGSKIIVSITTDEKNVIIKVKDHGRGIPEDILKLNDKRFHRGSNSLGIEGTGLGLSIVEHYAQLHGGKIEYQTIVNEGSTVTVYLPIRR